MTTTQLFPKSGGSRKLWRKFCFLCLGLLFFSCIACEKQEKISYSQNIQAILSNKCYACHGPDPSNRKAGLRLDIEEGLYDTLESGLVAYHSQNWQESEFLKRISSKDPDFQMPPPDFPKELDEKEIAQLSQWLEEGAKWEKHWAFNPLKTDFSFIPENKHPIDYFIERKLEEKDLTPNGPADTRTLFRRIYFDLLGLAPSPEDYQKFLDKKSEDAYEKLIDRLLDSPQYGERWARHWLDIVHYGESHGYDKDKRRSNSWPYRDYVIRSFNEDKPYGKFVEEQLAGDMLYPEDPEAIKALGFLAAGPWDLVGHVEVRDGTVDKRIVRNLDRDDMVTSTMSSFVGLTVHCARCHDHKFDPIKQEDYYALQAVFAGIDRADRPYDDDKEVHKKRTKLLARKKKANKTLKLLDKGLDAPTKLTLANFQKQEGELKRQVAQQKNPPAKVYGYHSVFESRPDHKKWIKIDLGKEYSIDKIVLHPGWRGEDLVMPGYGFPLRFSLEISQMPDFATSDTLLDFSQYPHSIRTDKAYEVNIEAKKARYLKLNAQELWKGRGENYFLAMAEIQVFSEGKNIARAAKVSATDAFRSKNWAPQFLTDGYNSWSLISGERIPPQNRNRIRQLEKKIEAIQNKAIHSRKEVFDARRDSLLEKALQELEEVTAALESMPKASYVYAAATEFRRQLHFAPADSIRPIYLLNRGDTEQATYEVNPGSISSIKALNNRFELKEGHSEGERRIALAKWITHPKNAFTWRSIVNRIWQYHFGKGIAASPNDFGKMGIPPTHPELLDYLATEFLNNGQSIKHLHKLILTSDAYKRSVSGNAKNHTLDAENNFLWQANRKQLSAEALRDAVLAVSGKLDLSMKGPGFDTFRYEDDHSPRYIYKDYNPYDQHSFRRAIYRSIIRSVPDPFMTSLDCADPSQSVAVRNETVTALQALSALNNPFMIRQAAFLAERLRAESSELEIQIRRVFELAFLREPSKEEAEEMMNYSKKHGLAATCRLIFAMNEFLYID